MPKVIYVAPGGGRREVEARAGDSVMQTALNHDVEGIVGECGGSLMCATCHVYVDDAWREAVGGRVAGEDMMLEGAAAEIKPASRLSCQIVMRDELDGLTVHLPETQY
jgi:2Fe-2S ferredoxin